MNFFLFLVSYILNPVIIHSIPQDIVSQFLTTYMWANVIFSLAFTIFFSTKLIKYAYSFIVISFIVLLVLIFFEGNYVWAILPFSILLGDYLCTQAAEGKISYTFRLVLIFTALPFIFPESDFLLFIVLRVGAILVFGFYLMLINKKPKRLEIAFPIKWIATTYLFYSGTLLLLPYLILDSYELKYWFIVTQVGLGLVLKKLDFEVRSVNENIRKIGVVIYVAAFSLPLVISVYYFNVSAIFIYYLSFLALAYLGLQNRKGNFINER